MCVRICVSAIYGYGGDYQKCGADVVFRWCDYRRMAVAGATRRHTRGRYIGQTGSFPGVCRARSVWWFRILGGPDRGYQ